MSSAEDMSKPDSAVLEGGEEQKASRQPSRGDIAQAVASRLQSQGDSVEGEEAKQENAQKAKVRKTVNEVTATSNYERACACLGLVHTLLENIIRHPSEIKYRSFKAAQPKIARDVLTLDAGKSLLIDIGFRTRAVAFQQEWFVPVEWTEKSLGFKRIEWSREVVGTKLHEFEENAERVRSNKEREKSFEQSRKSRALEEAREDRERVALRAQREKAARSAAEAKAAADKEAEVTSEARSHVDNAADAGWDASADD